MNYLKKYSINHLSAFSFFYYYCVVLLNNCEVSFLCHFLISLNVFLNITFYYFLSFNDMVVSFEIFSYKIELFLHVLCIHMFSL